ncbi:GTP cyclohydrolase I [Mucor velutinosus]|uniref:GTP cyclohydrolase I n=1 Tax=Mucor velutinosus TaxID=708070 RepID=A0AAN7D4I8_9FUNG|nr:GTP cyclohydrolase I [Mucor velutinosus]
MKSVIAAIAAIAATVVSAQNIVSSQPSTNQVLTAGTTANIVWAPVDGTISTIDLRQGAASALTLLQNIATNVPASTGSYSWNIPATIPAGTDYALSFGQSPNVTYTPFFTIKAAAGGAASSGAASSGAASSSAAPASSAASAASSATSKASSAASSATSKASSAASSAASATTTPAASAGNKNMAAVGAAAVAGAVVAALI